MTATGDPADWNRATPDTRIPGRWRVEYPDGSVFEIAASFWRPGHRTTHHAESGTWHGREAADRYARLHPDIPTPTMWGRVLFDGRNNHSWRELAQVTTYADAIRAAETATTAGRAAIACGMLPYARTGRPPLDPDWDNPNGRERRYEAKLGRLSAWADAVDAAARDEGALFAVRGRLVARRRFRGSPAFRGPIAEAACAMNPAITTAGRFHAAYNHFRATDALSAPMPPISLDKAIAWCSLRGWPSPRSAVWEWSGWPDGHPVPVAVYAALHPVTPAACRLMLQTVAGRLAFRHGVSPRTVAEVADRAYARRMPRAPIRAVLFHNSVEHEWVNGVIALAIHECTRWG